MVTAVTQTRPGCVGLPKSVGQQLIRNHTYGGHMRSHQRIGALAVTFTLLAAACGGDDSTGGSDAADDSTPDTAPATAPTTQPAGDDAPADTSGDSGGDGQDAVRPVVKVGSVNSLTGPVPFPEASAAAAAVFDRYNEDPNGTVTIEYIIEDDAADPAIASQAARKLATDDNVAMMAGAASLVDCAVNGAFYGENNLYAVQGTGVDETCFISPNIAPINTGPFVGLTTSLYFASEVLGHDAICYFQFDTGAPTDPNDAAIDRWSEITGKELVTFDLYTPGDDFTPFVTKAIDEGCTAVFEGGLDFTAIAFDQAAAGQNATFDVIHFTSAYTENVADTIGSPSTNLYANSEFEPFTNIDSEALADWFELMGSADVALTSFAQGGYLAGLATIAILESAGLEDGNDTDEQRTKIQQAVFNMEPFEHPMLGSPYIFGDAPTHNPNQASKFVQLVDGEWVQVGDDFIVITDFE